MLMSIIFDVRIYPIIFQRNDCIMVQQGIESSHGLSSSCLHPVNFWHATSASQYVIGLLQLAYDNGNLSNVELHRDCSHDWAQRYIPEVILNNSRQICAEIFVVFALRNMHDTFFISIRLFFME